jgi:predicted permease
LTYLLQDFRIALRMLRRSRLSSVTAVLALGLGMGAGTAIFSVMDAALLRSLPKIARPGELISFERWQAGQLLGDMGYPDYQDYAGQLRSFSGVVAEANARLSFAEEGRAERVAGALVSGNYFSVVGVKAALGRLLLERDDREGESEPVTVLSFGFWQRAFGGVPGVVGSRIDLNGHTFRVVGVASSGFRGTDPEFQPDLWMPITLAPIAMPQLSGGALHNRAWGWLRIFGRLRPPASLSGAQAEVNAIAARLANEYPLTNHMRTVTLVEGVGLWSDERAELRHFLELLLLSVALLQLLTCASVSNLLLARGAARQREVAVRLALGASRGRLMRLFLLEGALLAMFAGIVGVALAKASMQLAVFLPESAFGLRDANLQLDQLVLIFAFLLGAGSGLLVACIPAWLVSRGDLVNSVKAGSPGSGRARSRTRGALVAAQIALSMMLLTAAGAAVRTLQRGLAANPITHPQEVLLCSLDLTILGYSSEQGERLYQTLLDRLRALPGVTAVSLGSSVPPEEVSGRMSIFYPGEEPAAGLLAGREFELGLRVDDDAIGPGFFRTLGIPVTEGREFGDHDRTETLPVAVVSDALAKRLWPGKDPVGRRISLGSPRQVVTVTGVVKDVASRTLLGEPPLHLYLPFWQVYGGRAKLVVRAAVSSTQLSTSLREAVVQLDRRLPLFGFQTMRQHIAAGLWRQRIAAELLGAFGLLALSLASMGLYNIVAHYVSQRTREIGIRIAIGACAGQVYFLVLRHVLLWSAGGAVAGFPLAMLGIKVLQKGIPGTRPNDPLTVGVTLAILGAIAMVAGLIPARRAAKMNPVAALRHE